MFSRLYHTITVEIINTKIIIKYIKVKEHYKLVKEVQLLERGGGIRFKLRKENGKVEIFGVGEGWWNQIWTWEEK